ncbi:MAG: tRNA uridine-5-carboxymethylaminomethyl(34) synthesis enzyme MnmG [Nitrospinae bacterium RIFCSPLOWO2_02_FULL_39_110]|nr:MAG: tRNA uridine-5-carboxymethylaminomethyl(34) synthesis enzyme MnmG [Nitrospinae bacterium RIFCSPHIGHO2_02_39_11]OGV98564.1 MAG: tRNA uridine-5-carboxymethylaminomethyl(34) synthesis enzyme MnmG [Nitrospinae bacterium RIFCSPHIGHO2_12_FULL_39_42]OGW01296.1 MAG: tRNA uridine-5-carboxymethylaminomethyl(34) synthesis enzyme MnmG [Nitrospinae bacterium RIFCSPLOWO2_02_39_17]OGW02283.1 MAG: tRNA uridine-5-carboxymethylaminomethyl(34) synthesis enzyme MnmG [Nitrospinae bacterium RIFCSPHIGHO2_02_FU
MYIYPKEYDVIVIGAGHAGCEAALAASRMGCETLIITMNLDSIALMSCNPAIGGIAKGHLVREIDALGGEMAKCIDKTGIQFRVLNTSKGPAVQAYRAQADKQLYRLEMKSTLEKEERLNIKQGIVERILVENGEAVGVETNTEISYKSKAVILTTGTFLKGLIHIGLINFSAGRAGEFPSEKLSDNLRELGFEMGRLKTGTPPRLDAKTIDFSRLIEQRGDAEPRPFSYSTEKITQKQIPCYLTYTNEETHKIIKENMDRSPLYCGAIKGVGPRYCPSIEDKVKRFPEKDRHQVFLEPEGYDTKEYYANGVSTSLPIDVQVKFLRTIKGLENVEIMRPGYAIEYDFVPPAQLLPTLETKLIKNLYHAGQINGTSGYEEAAAQGLTAGINASLSTQGKEPLIINRSEAYIGVLIDDLVTKGTQEPYRMFTSRAEYRLILRQDNADLRLRERGYKAGLVKEEEFVKFVEKRDGIKSEIDRLGKTVLKPSEDVNDKLKEVGTNTINEPLTLLELLRRPEIKYDDLLKLQPSVFSLQPYGVREQVEIQVKYEGYINRELLNIERFKRLEEKGIPQEVNFKNIPGLSNEAKEKLSKVRPISIGQASRISGVTPSAISILMIYLEQLKRNKLKTQSLKVF